MSDFETDALLALSVQDASLSQVESELQDIPVTTTVQSEGSTSRQLSQSHMGGSGDGGAGDITGQTSIDLLGELLEITEDQLVELRELTGDGDLLEQASGSGEGGDGGSLAIGARAAKFLGGSAIGAAGVGAFGTGVAQGPYESGSEGATEALEGLSGQGTPLGPMGAMNPMMGAMSSLSEFGRMSMTGLDLGEEIATDGVPDLSSMLNPDSVKPLGDLLNVDGLESVDKLLNVDALDTLEKEMRIDQLDSLEKEMQIDSLESLESEMDINKLEPLADVLNVSRLESIDIVDDLGLSKYLGGEDDNGSQYYASSGYEGSDGRGGGMPFGPITVSPDDIGVDLSSMDFRREVENAVDDALGSRNLGRVLEDVVDDKLQDAFRGR